MSYVDRLAACKKRLDNLFKEYTSLDLDDEEFDEQLEEIKKKYSQALRDGVAIVEEAHQANAAELPEVIAKAEKILDFAATLGYTGREEGAELFTNIPSYADTTSRPLVKQEREKGEFSAKMVKIGLMFLEFMKDSGMAGPGPGGLFPKLAPPKPWKDVVRLHPLSSKCARFHDKLPETAPPSDKSRALSVFQARAEVSCGDLYLPTGMYLSPSGKGLLVPGMAGWKNRAPYVSLYYPSQPSSDSSWTGEMQLLGLASVAHHGAIDDDTGLMFVGDDDRIKSYSYWDTMKNAPQGDLIPKHTMKSAGFTGPIAVLPNARLVRAGSGGKVGVWNLNELPTHNPELKGKKGLIGGSIADKNGEINTWRDDPEDIERSVGSSPTSTITMSDEDKFTIDLWHPHPSAASTMLAGCDGSALSYRCRAVDMEHNAKTTVRYLGHGGGINQISTSKGDPNTFVTAARDGYARLFDVRQPLPVLTIQASPSHSNCSAAVIAHPDGIPYVFASEKEDEAITMWDVRARAAIYDLATGNNVVTSLAWSDEHNELYAATECFYIDRNGYHMEYEPAKIPKSAVNDDDESDEEMGADNEDDWEDDDGDSGDSEEEYEETDQCWPGKAHHNETYFGHIFDSGDHRIYRYSFKTSPDPTILPPDGGVSSYEEGSYW